MIVLFDESGTPTINNDSRADWFLGVSVRYEEFDEEIIFKKSRDIFYLSKSSPVKNDGINDSRATKMAELLIDLPLHICVSKIDLSNSVFREHITSYESFGNIARSTYRNIRNRPIAQIIHTHMLDHCLFNTIESHVNIRNEELIFKIFIDNWSAPKNDFNILLEYRALSLQKQISSLKNKAITVHPIELLIHDSNKKRFIDSIASIVSRAYLKESNNKYCPNYENILRQSKKYTDEDATQYSINLMQRMMGQI
jgi:hypothetical protein